MTIRVTVGSSSAASLAGLQAASSRLAALQEKLSTGRQIGRPSDDPAGTVRALQLRGDLKRNAQYARNTSDAAGWLSVADTTYGQITDLVQKARTLTVQAMNDGASTGQSAGAIADQLTAIRGAVLKLANATYNGRPIFGGTTAGGGAFADDGTTVRYVGDDGTVRRTIGDRNTIQINQAGPTALGTDASGGGLFALIDTIAGDLRTSGAPAAGALADLDAALGDLSSARAASGAALSRVQAAQASQATDKVTLQTQLSSLEDIDLPQVAIAVSTANVVYQASLQTTAGIRQLSLLDFLR